MELSKVNAKDGVEYILTCLKGPLEQRFCTRSVHCLQTMKLLPALQKRQSVNTSIATSHKRIERDLQSVGIQTGAMHDQEGIVSLSVASWNLPWLAWC